MKKIIAILSLTAAAAGCSAPATPVPGGSPGGTPNPTASASGSPARDPGTTRVTIYYLVAGTDDVFLTPERHQVARTSAIAKAALDELLHGRPQDEDHTVPFAKGTKVNSVVIRDGLATVDWNAAVLESGGGARIETLAIQSVVYTLTEFATISKVRFTVEGRSSGTASNGRRIEDLWGHVGLSAQPWDRDPEIEALAPITLWTPLDGASSAGTLRLTGLAQTFEANVGIVLRNADGKVVLRTSTTALEAAPAREPFDETITFTAPATPQEWTLQVIEDSAMDGSVVFLEDRAIRVG